MSTREMALSIFNQLNEKQLEGFIAMYNGIFTVQEGTADSEDEQAKRDAAFDYIMSVRKSVPDFDEKAAYLEYLDERYGV